MDRITIWEDGELIVINFVLECHELHIKLYCKNY